MTDQITQDWLRNRSDEIAVENGCWFNPDRAAHVLKFFRDYMKFYEGDSAGKQFNPLPWQVELLSRAFGWVRHSVDWGREVRRFRKVVVFAPKKQGKSPLAAGVGLYLFLFDGEQGQKVFSCAHDGKQAKIVHTHASMMVRKSPALNDECKVNKSTGRISHLPSNSFYDILAGDNIPGQEGLNGSAIIDEAHVVDDRLAKVLEYMGASRSEPMQFVISTAGDNPDGWGRREYDYGKAVESGQILDDQVLFVAYEAPQDATDDDIVSKPEIWKAANPSWGETIKEEEFRTSLSRAKSKSLADWITFKRYRLNIWATSVNPWLPMDRWSACRHTFTEDDLAGRRCFAGIDLSKTQDMSSLVLIFPDDDGEQGFVMLPYFWLPEETAAEKNHLASFLEWAKLGYLELTPGNRIDYRYIKRRFIELSKKFTIEKVVYDKTYAEQLTQEINEETGIERMEFGQTIMNFAGPTAGFEGAVIAAKLRHNGHPIMTWQAGNCQVRTDVNMNKRPVKPKPNDVRKIDGVVAAIMAFAFAEQSQPTAYIPGSLLDRDLMAESNA